jgi:hypothetical protein
MICPFSVRDLPVVVVSAADKTWLSDQFRFVLDVEQHNNDGTVQKARYEANVTMR